MSSDCGTVNDTEKSLEVKMPKKKSTYTCSRCGNSVTLLITPTYPPTCSNHTGGGVEMKLVKDQ